MAGFDKITLNGRKFQIVDKVTKSLAGMFAPKMVIGDYDLDSNPEISEWGVSDNSGGALCETFRPNLPTVNWYSNCNTDYPGHTLMPRMFHSCTMPVFYSITDGGMEAWTNPTTLTNWTTSGCTMSRSTTHPHGGTYEALMSVAPEAVGYIYQNVTPSASILGQTIYFYIWMCGPLLYGTARAYVTTDGSGGTTTYSSAASGGSWTCYTVTVALPANATTMRVGVQLDNHLEYTHTATIYLDDAMLFDTTSGQQIIEFNGNIYCGAGNMVYILNGAGDTFTFLKNLPSYITSIIVAVDDYAAVAPVNVLYFFMGDTINYFRMSTANVFTQSNSAAAYYGVTWDNKLWKVNSTGLWARAVNPGVASPTWTTSDPINGLMTGDIRKPMVYKDANEDSAIYMATPRILKIYDATADEWLDTDCVLPTHPQGSLDCTLWHSSLFIPAGLGITNYTVDGSDPAIITTNSGFDQLDSVVSTQDGCIAKFVPGYNRLFAFVDSSYAPGTSYSSIWATQDGKTWSQWWTDTLPRRTMGSGIVSSVVGSRLWCMVGAAVYYCVLPYGLANPIQLSTTEYAYNITGTLITPKFDAAWEAGNKLAVQLRVGTANCSATNTVTVKYRLGQTAHDLTTGWTTLGIINTSISPTLYTFASGAGILFSTIQFAFLLNSASLYQSPDLLYFIFSHNKIIVPTWTWQMRIQEFEDINTEHSITDLETAALTQTLIPFVFKGVTYYVNIKQVQAVLDPYEEAIGAYDIMLTQPV